MAFDPDAYLAQTEQEPPAPANAPFDPDAYLAGPVTGPQPAPEEQPAAFDPDAYLAQSPATAAEPSAGRDIAAGVVAAAHDLPYRIAQMGDSINLAGAKAVDAVLGTKLARVPQGMLEANKAATLQPSVPQTTAGQFSYGATSALGDLSYQIPAMMMTAGTVGPATTVAGQIVTPATQAATRSLAASTAMGAAQSGLSTYAQTQDPAQALNNAAITGLVTRGFGSTGVEAVFKKEGIKGVGNRVLKVLKEMHAEGYEEGFDQAMQGFSDRATREPDKPLTQILMETLMAYGIGSFVSGVVNTAGQVIDSKTSQDTPPFDPDAYLASPVTGPQPTDARAAFEARAANAGVTFIPPDVTEPGALNDQGQTTPPPAEQPTVPGDPSLDSAAANPAPQPAGIPESPETRPTPAPGEALTLEAQTQPAPARRRAAPSIPYAPMGTPDLVDFIAENGGISRPDRGGETDDRTENLKGIYAPLARGTRPPDVMAQMAYDAGLIEDPTASALWNNLGRNVAARQSLRAQTEAQDKADARQARESGILAKALAPGRGRQAVSIDTLRVGDVLQAKGRTIKVISIDPNTDAVQVDAGEDMDYQLIPAGTVVYADAITQTTPANPELAAMPFSQATQGRPVPTPQTMNAGRAAVTAQASRDGMAVRFYDSVDQIEDPALRARIRSGGYNGFMGQAQNGAPQLAVILDRITSPDEALRVYREELAHAALRTGLADGYNRILNDFADEHLTSDELAPLMADYPQAPGESDAAYRLRLADEFIAKLGRENPQSSLWKQFVAAVRELLAKAGLTKLTAQEASRVILRRARSLSNTGKATVAAGEYRFSTPEATPTFDPTRPLVAAGVNLPVEVRPVMGGMEYVKAVEMPELVALVKTLTGEIPKLKRFAKAHGKFYGLGNGLIKLDPRIFTNPIQAAQTLAHEIGHLVDYLPDSTLKRGNLLGRLATLNSYVKTTLPELPGTGKPTLTTDDRTRLRAAAARLAGSRPKDNVAAQLGWANEVRMHYGRLVEEEIKSRGLTTNAVLRGELIDLSKEWRGDWADGPQSYQKYRESAIELYADAISVLFNNPFLLADRAPTFYKMFWGYLDQKPDVKQALLDVQTLLHQPKLEMLGTREERIKAAYLKGDEIFKSKWQEQKARMLDWRAWLKGLKTELYNAYDPIIRRQRQVEKLGPLTAKQRIDWLFDAHPLGDNKVYLLLQRIQGRVINELEAAGIDRNTLGYYLQMTRILNEDYDVKTEDGLGIEKGGRRNLANPGGHTPETARMALLKLRLELGMEGMTALERAANNFHDIVFGQMQEAVDAGLINRDTFENVIKPNRGSYATFVPLKYWDTYVSSRIAQQIGTLDDIGNPFSATVMKLVALNRAAHENLAHRETARFMQEFFGQEIQPAETLFDGRGLRPQEPKEPGKGLLTVRENGATKGFVVPQDVAQMFERLTPESKMATIQMLSRAFRGIVYPLIIRYNPVFQLAMSPMRDFQRLMVNAPDGSHWRIAKAYMRELWKALADPTASTQRVRLDGYTRPGPDATPQQWQAWRDAQEMMHSLAIWTPFESFGRSTQDLDTFNQILQKYNLVPVDEQPKWLDHTLGRWVTSGLRKIEYAGQVLEGMPKTVAYKVMTKDLGWNPEQTGVYIRNHIGVPNFTKRGKLAYIANSVFPFWTVFLNGWESDARQAMGKVSGKSRAGWWLSWMIFGGGMMTILQTLAEEGLLGDELKELLTGASEFDKQQTTVIPLGFTEGGDYGKKVLYLRIPKDETSRTIGGLLRQGIKAGFAAARGEDVTQGEKAWAFAGGQIPDWNPVIKTIQAWNQFAGGQNPRDDFRGSNILSSTEYLAGGAPAFGAMAYWTLEQTGATNFVRWDPKAQTTQEVAVGALPILNRFLKITDAGYRSAQAEGEKQEDATSARIRISFAKEVQKLATEQSYLKGLGHGSRTTEQELRYQSLNTWKRVVYDPAKEYMADNPEDKDMARILRENVKRDSADYLR